MVVTAIATSTSTAAVMTEKQRCNGNATAMVMDGDGQCDGNATATTVIEGTAGTQQRSVAMEGATAMAINGATATQ